MVLFSSGIFFSRDIKLSSFACFYGYYYNTWTWTREPKKKNKLTLTPTATLFRLSPPLSLPLDIIVCMICYFFDNDGMHYNSTMDYITAIIVIIIIKKSVSSYHLSSFSTWLETRDNIFLVNRQNLSQSHRFISILNCHADYSQPTNHNNCYPISTPFFLMIMMIAMRSR